MAEGHDARGRQFIRRFLLHVLPDGFHRIRNYGLCVSGSTRAIDIVRVRRLFALAPPEDLAPAATTSTDAACPVLRPSPHHP